MALNCLTKNFALLWKLCWKKEFSLEIWSEPNPQLPLDYFSRLSHEWTRDSPLRTELARRQALLEIDVIVAQAFGLTLEDLLFIYRSGFRVMRGYDQETYYDQNGRIVFTPNRGGLPGAGLPRKVEKKPGVRYQINGFDVQDGYGFEDVKDMKEGTVSKSYIDNTLPEPVQKTITYVAPFFRMNREEDYAKAWEFFAEREKQDQK